jgi:Leucine-rich repeat (LRR) protein
MFFSFQVQAQRSKTYDSLEDALKNPEQVYFLYLVDQNLKTIPEEIGLFTNLEDLNLSNNILEKLPESISISKNWKF